MGAKINVCPTSTVQMPSDHYYARHDMHMVHVLLPSSVRLYFIREARKKRESLRQHFENLINDFLYHLTHNTEILSTKRGDTLRFHVSKPTHDRIINATEITKTSIAAIVITALTREYEKHHGTDIENQFT